MDRAEVLVFGSIMQHPVQPIKINRVTTSFNFLSVKEIRLIIPHVSPSSFRVCKNYLLQQQWTLNCSKKVLNEITVLEGRKLIEYLQYFSVQ